MMNNKLLFFVTEDWYFYSHRLPLALAAKEDGYEVSVVTRVREHGEKIRAAGIRVFPIELSRRSVNPLNEIRIIMKLISIYRKVEPDIVHHVALKPVIYGTMASFFVDMKGVVNALAGLGLLFCSESRKIKMMRPFIKGAFKLLLNRKRGRLILQNPDDVKILSQGKIVQAKRVHLILGSGVCINQFNYKTELPGVPIVILASRLLWEKGVGDFVKAATTLKRQGVSARFVLVGEGDHENPSAISDQQLRKWHSEGNVEWWGHRDNMPTIFAKSHVICLPTFYGEGVPKVLIEAASCGRPIVTTDTPGCREIVRDNENGFLVPVRNVSELADAMLRLLLDSNLRKRMGLRGREIVKADFSIEKVVEETLEIYRELLAINK